MIRLAPNLLLQKGEDPNNKCEGNEKYNNVVIIYNNNIEK